MKVSEMSAKKQNDSVVDSMVDLFGSPPLIKGEDETRYWRLHAAFEHDVQPKTIFDKIRVRELTDKHWQQQRCRTSAASLVDAAFIEALASLLRPFIVPSIMSVGEDPASKLAREYYSGEAKRERMKEVEIRMMTNMISPEQIRAKAMQLCGNSISMLTRMEKDCETSLRILRKENAHRRSDPGQSGSGEAK
jgi:hypothetical protein